MFFFLRCLENGKRGFKLLVEWMSLLGLVYWFWFFVGNEIGWCLLMKKILWIRYFILRRDVDEIFMSDVCCFRLRKLIDCWKFFECGIVGWVVRDLL